MGKNGAVQKKNLELNLLDSCLDEIEDWAEIIAAEKEVVAQLRDLPPTGLKPRGPRP